MKNRTSVTCTVIFIVLTFILLSCSTVDTPPVYTPGQDGLEDMQQEDVWDDPYMGTSLLKATRTHAPFGDCVLLKNGTIIDVQSQTSYHLCSDPLCTDEDHNQIGACPVAAFYYVSDFLVPEYGSNGQMTVYFLSLDLLPHEEGLGWDFYCFWRYHVPTQTMERISETFKPTGATWSYSPQENAIYYTRYTQSSDNGGRTEIALHALDCKTGQDRFVSLLPTHLVADAYAHGELMLSDMAGNIYTIDTEAKNPQPESIGLQGRLYNDYIYYYENVQTVTVYMPEELREYTVRDPQGDRMQIEVGDLYRIAYGKSNSKPELVAESISKTSGYNFDDNYLLVANGEPVYRASALNDGNTYYHVDDPTAPAGAQLVNLFSPNSGEYRLINLNTLQSSTIMVPDYTLVNPIFSLRRGYLFADVTSYDVDRIIQETNSLTFTKNYGTLIYQGGADQLTSDSIRILTFKDQ